MEQAEQQTQARRWWAYAPRCQVVGAPAHVEGITAGMARISRDPTPIPELIRQARQKTELARKRNETIVYGYGHTSIAEHGVFSLAIWDIPRSLSRRLVAHRLASYTQQSGRYIPFERVPRPYFLPAAYRQGRQRAIFTRAVAQAHAAYQTIYAACTDHLLRENPDLKRGEAERKATEDARYCLPLAQTTQVGMTANARQWGLVITRLLSGALPEEVALGEALFRRLHPLAPSLFPAKYITAQPFPGSALAALAALPLPAGLAAGPAPASPSAVLIDYDPQAEAKLAAALLFRAHPLDAAALAALTAQLDRPQVEAILAAAFTGIGAHDTALREFELVQYVVEVVCSEACLHQLIRHRMTTQLVQEAAPALGVTVPPLLVAAGQAERYHAAIAALEEAYIALGADARARILLANGHAVRALLRLDARELIELSRLRTDHHAQWEIRDLSRALVEQVRAVHPAIARACGGRDAFKAGRLQLALPAD